MDTQTLRYKELTDYHIHLSEMWQKAIAPRAANAPTVVSTFAGGGGSLTGYMMAGYDDLLAVEYDDNAVNVLMANYPKLRIFHGDIKSLTSSELKRLTGLKTGELDILDGSPPCQGFSMAGKRILEDDRNKLFLEFSRLLNDLKPKTFIMENVPGMVKGKMKLAFSEILSHLKSCGYKVKAALLNAKYFGVPQSRERLIFIGIREDLGIPPTFPKVQTKPISVKDAWINVEQQEPPYISPALAKIVPHIPMGKTGSYALKRASYFSTRRLHWDRPCYTICKGDAGGRSGIIHPTENRCITLAEAKWCASFPDEYKFLGGHRKSIERIGNSVPPLFIQAIAQHIRFSVLQAD